jgi:NADH-quinone oxidoreductase subunit E
MLETLDAPRTATRRFTRVCEILAEYDHRPSKLIPILQKVQEEYRYLPEEILTYVATSLDLPAAQVYGVATFYTHFALEPKGKYVVKLCDGTACHVKNSIPILESIRQHLRLPEGKDTTEDLLFTVETVSCLGACGLAPVVLVNEDVHGAMTPEKATRLITDIEARESDNDNPDENTHA